MSTFLPRSTPIIITSFGYLHANPPTAHITLDLRRHFRDPHVDPTLRQLTAHDQEVVDAVLATPGIDIAIQGALALILGYTQGPTAGDITVAVGCAGGRHRAPTVVSELGRRTTALVAGGAEVTVIHRDLDKPVINH